MHQPSWVWLTSCKDNSPCHQGLDSNQTAPSSLLILTLYWECNAKSKGFCDNYYNYITQRRKLNGIKKGLSSTNLPRCYGWSAEAVAAGRWCGSAEGLPDIEFFPGTALLVVRGARKALEMTGVSQESATTCNSSSVNACLLKNPNRHFTA